jgi:hypothetical protein
VDIESISWSAIPEQLRAEAVANAAQWMRKGSPVQRWNGRIGNCNLQMATICMVDGPIWCVVELDPDGEELKKAIARLDVWPLMPE